MAALACETRRVRVGCLVFCVVYRHPAVLANAAVTIDHLSGGRCEMGIGSGWNELEAAAYGIPFPPVPERLDRLEETAVILRRLWREEKTTVQGRYYRLERARCEPKPLQREPRLWIGGQGERRLLRIVARHGDAWNAPFLSPEIYAARNATLDAWCDRERRDPKSILRSVNVGLVIGRTAAEVRREEAKLAQQFGPLLGIVRGGIMVGTPPEIVDRLGAYAGAGAELVIIALRAPFDWDGLELFVHDVMPAFA
jgi:alkanesulfonate monooxygenase SsuD/methylene tetrahydromethanopterin reductase-like flavin-dependent oxidoreductase (luciferase family)